MNKAQHTTRNIKNGQKVVNMNILAINKLCNKLKVWCFKKPKNSYCHRYGLFKKNIEPIQEVFQIQYHQQILYSTQPKKITKEPMPHHFSTMNTQPLAEFH